LKSVEITEEETPEMQEKKEKIKKRNEELRKKSSSGLSLF